MRFLLSRFTVGALVGTIGFASVIAFVMGVLLDAPSWLVAVLLSVLLVWLIVARLVIVDPLSQRRRRDYGKVFQSADFRSKPFEAPFGDGMNGDDRPKE